MWSISPAFGKDNSARDSLYCHLGHPRWKWIADSSLSHIICVCGKKQVDFFSLDMCIATCQHGYISMCSFSWILSIRKFLNIRLYWNISSHQTGFLHGNGKSHQQIWVEWFFHEGVCEWKYVNVCVTIFVHLYLHCMSVYVRHILSPLKRWKKK